MFRVQYEIFLNIKVTEEVLRKVLMHGGTIYSAYLFRKGQ